MDHRVILTGKFAKGVKPGTPLWVKTSKITKKVMENSVDKNYPWEVLVSGQKWDR